MKSTCFKFRTTLLALLLQFVVVSVFAESGIYVGGHFRRNRPTTVTSLKASGFTYVILFNVQVEANGDLTTDGETICKNGVYVFGNTSPNYVSDVMSLKTGITSIRRVECCVGGWGNTSYDNIKVLVNSTAANGGTGTSSILYKNFKALKEAIPCIDAINNDIEQGYDVNSGKAFHVMLYDLGMKTTLAPYMNKPYWTSLATGINSLRKGAVDRIYIQCYDGGAGNNPSDWNINGITLHAGLTNYGSTAAAATAQMTTWKNNSTVSGGFFWVYNDESTNLKNYAAAVNKVFGGGEVINMDKMVPQVTAFPGANYQDTAVTFAIGKQIKAALLFHGLTDKTISSIKVSTGFKVDLYKSSDCTGEAISITESTPDLTSLSIDNSISSMEVKPNSDLTLNQKLVYVKNRKSGMYLTLASESLNAGIAIQQKAFSGKTSQQFQLSLLTDGGYRIVNQFSKKTLTIRDASTENGGKLEQGTYTLLSNQKFVLYKNEGFYKVIPFNSIKCITVDGAQINTPDAEVVLGEANSNTETDWEIVSTTSAIDPNQISDIEVYPSQVSDIIYINSGDKTIERVELFDMKGMNKQFSHQNLQKIDVSSLQAGMYYLKVYAHAMEPKIFKFIKTE